MWLLLGVAPQGQSRPAWPGRPPAHPLAERPEWVDGVGPFSRPAPRGALPTAARPPGGLLSELCRVRQTSQNVRVCVDRDSCGGLQVACAQGCQPGSKVQTPWAPHLCHHFPVHRLAWGPQDLQGMVPGLHFSPHRAAAGARREVVPVDGCCLACQQVPAEMSDLRNTFIGENDSCKPCRGRLEQHLPFSASPCVQGSDTEGASFLLLAWLCFLGLGGLCFLIC